ncbi:probable glutamate receptor [Procambarus clarkii]|uniref:probable glutamate receptor n=1 Tax=Procambarus clarkii TaxID=6728 RepID=UPI0037437ECE
MKGSQHLVTLLWRLAWLCPVTCTHNAPSKQQTEAVILGLLRGPLAQDNILFVIDSGALTILDIDIILAKRGTTPSGGILVVSEESTDFFLQASLYFLRGRFLTTVFIFAEDPQRLLDSLDHRWNPDFLLLLNLNPTINTTILFWNDKIQRSRHIALIEPEMKFVPPKFKVFTSKSFKQNTVVKYPMGLWKEKDFASKTSLFPERLKTLDGSVLQLASFCDNFPFLYPQNDVCVGSNFDLLDIIAAKLNFTYTTQMEPKDHKWGAMENGTWTGMLGDLMYNDKDLAINLIQLSDEIIYEFDISNPYFVESYVFVLRVPPPLPLWRGLVYPFSGFLWLAIISTIVLVIALLTLCLHLVPDQYDLSNVFILVLGGVVCQGVKQRLEATWTRLWLGCWLLACVILTTAYTGNLVAFLSVPVYPTRIETVEQLAASGLRICMQDYGSFVPAALKVSTDPALYTLGNKMDLFPYAYLNFDVGFKWVVSNTHSLLDTYSYLVNIVDHYGITDDVYFMKEMVYPGYVSWILRKNCPYTPLLVEALTRLQEAGLVDYEYNTRMAKVRGRDQVGHDKVSAGRSLQLGQLLGAFMLWALGLTAAALVLLVEFLVHSRVLPIK